MAAREPRADRAHGAHTARTRARNEAVRAMSVLLANISLTAHVRAHSWARDAHGVPVPTDADAITDRGPYPSNAEEEVDATWVFRLDVRTWPLRAGDEVSDGTRTWVLSGVPQLHRVPGYPYADFVSAEGTLNPPRVP